MKTLSYAYVLSLAVGLSIALADVTETEHALSALANSADIEVKKGLPNPFTHEKAWLQERQEPLERLYGFEFKRLVGTCSGEAASKIVGAIGEAFREVDRPVKRCGSFHPDYVVRWRDDKVEYALLVCFTCNEAMLYADKARTAYFDIPGGRMKLIREILDGLEFKPNEEKANQSLATVFTKQG